MIILVQKVKQQIEAHQQAHSIAQESESIILAKKSHPIKAQLVADESTKEILKIDCAKGNVHDFELYKQSKLCLLPGTEPLLDLGYLGIAKIHSNVKIPYKFSKHHKLTKEEKQFNRKHSQRRIRIENIIRKCKIFHIVKLTYRGKHKNYGLVWNVVARLVNLKNANIN